MSANSTGSVAGDIRRQARTFWRRREAIEVYRNGSICPVGDKSYYIWRNVRGGLAERTTERIDLQCSEFTGDLDTNI